MLPAGLQILHVSGSHERNLTPLCSAVISSNDASTQEQKEVFYSVEQKQNAMERRGGCRKQDERCHFTRGRKPPELMGILY